MGQQQAARALQAGHQQPPAAKEEKRLVPGSAALQHVLRLGTARGCGHRLRFAVPSDFQSKRASPGPREQKQEADETRPRLHRTRERGMPRVHLKKKDSLFPT